MKRLNAATIALALLIGTTGAAPAPTPTQAPAEPLPVAAAKNGFTPDQMRDIRNRYSYGEVISAGDVSLFHFLNLNIWLPTASIARAAAVIPLAAAPDAAIGSTRIKGAGPTLAEFIALPAARTQGILVIHRGRIAFESYPGMRESDSHVWMSIAKTSVSLVVRLLTEEGRIDVTRPIEAYLPAFANTAWAGTAVQDILDMASGMDIVETQANRKNLRSLIARYNFAANGEKNSDGLVESQQDVIRSAVRLRPPGQVFEYSSVNTTVLALLAEAVENKRWNDIFGERVWSKMAVEGDAMVAVAPDSTPQANGLIASRLRDLGRYGLLYTPSRAAASREQIVSPAYLAAIQTGGRKAIFNGGEIGAAMQQVYFPSDPPTANSWQWDGVWDDGDFYKGGVYGQGLYVSPKQDLVIVWFSTVMKTDLPDYARQIASDMRQR